MIYRFDDLALDTDRRELRRGTAEIHLEPQVFDLLVYLIQNRERVVSRDDLFAAVWDGRYVSESALSTRINAVRSAIGDSGKAQRLIRTLPRKGVRFVGVVRVQKDTRDTGPVTELDPSHTRHYLPTTKSRRIGPHAKPDVDWHPACWLPRWHES